MNNNETCGTVVSKASGKPMHTHLSHDQQLKKHVVYEFFLVIISHPPNHIHVGIKSLLPEHLPKF